MPDAAHQWAPLSPAEVGTLFATADFDWWLAGGHALDFFANATWREHEDIDVLILRPELPALLAHLDEWDIAFADPPGTLRMRLPGETGSSAHDFWLKRRGSACWQLQVMVDDAAGVFWQSRRNPKLTRNRQAIGWRHPSGLPCLAAEIQLFYKAKAPRPKDEADFAKIVMLLSIEQRSWLTDAITHTYGAEHSWLSAL